MYLPGGHIEHEDTLNIGGLSRDDAVIFGTSALSPCARQARVSSAHFLTKSPRYCLHNDLSFRCE